MQLSEYITNYQQKINKNIKSELNQLTISSRLKEAMLYSFKAGGKRLRPILLIASYETYSTNISKVMSTALALEMIHTYSLIHDDLPAMDDDDLRRGKPTNHKAFDEATAILAGDALLTYSFESIAEDPLLMDQEKVKLMKWLSRASGPKGMVAGQMLDLQAEDKQITIEELENIHTLKTGELIQFAVIAGAYLGQATNEQLHHLKTYAYYLGLIFQIQDDILDVIGDQEKIGKPIGSDELNEKSTYPQLLGLEGAIEQRNAYVIKAKTALNKAEADHSYLLSLTEYLTQRDY